MNGKGKNLLVGWGFRGRKYRVSATEFFEDVHTHNTSEQIREDIWTNWFFGAFLDQETTRYTVSAQSVGLGKGYALQVDAGSYTTTSQDVNLLAARLVSITAGSYTATGIDVTLTVGTGPQNYTLPVDYSGSTVTAQSVGVLLGRKLPVNGTELSVISEAGLKANRVLNIAQNGYIVSANNANLYKGFSTSIDPLIVNVSANGVGFFRSYRLPFSGSYLMTGYELRGGIQLTKPATVVNEVTTEADVVTAKTISTTITTQVVL
jgi:hypothetical protein